jgi:transposase InsO family protein
MVAKGMRTTTALRIAQIPRSTYYYKPTGNPKGKVPSSHTYYKSKWVKNEFVVATINKLLEPEFIDYGYIRVANALKNMGFVINKKKVYRLMKQHQLLYPSKHVFKAGKVYVKHTSPICNRPFEVIEIDIKYVYIHGIRKHLYLITMLDVFSRMALVWDLCHSMKTKNVLSLLDQLFTRWLIPCNIDPNKLSVKIRTDNGSQFVARLFRQHLTLAHIDNEYIHPGTPQQNGHIEAFHGTVSNLVCRKYYFEDISEAEETFKRFFHTYNHKRIMQSILYQTPVDFIKLWAKGKIDSRIEKNKMKYFFREKPADKSSVDSCSEFFIGHNKINDILYSNLTLH